MARAAAPERLVLAHPGAAPPYLFRGPDGRPAGLLADYWRLVGEKSGLNVELRIAQDAPSQVAQGRFAGLAGLVRPSGDDPRFLFSQPLLDMRIGLFVPRHAGGGVHGVVGLVAGDPSAIFLRDLIPNFRERVYADSPSLAAGLVMGQVQAAAGPTLSLRYALNRLGGGDDFIVARSFPGPELCAAVRRGDGALLTRLNAGIALVSPKELAGLAEKWSGRRSRLPVWPFGLAAVLSLFLAFAAFWRARRVQAAAIARVRETSLLRENLMREMARHKKTQELFAAAIDQSSSAIIIVSPDGEFAPVLNRQALKLLDLAKPSAFLQFIRDGSWTFFTRSGRRVPQDEMPIARVLAHGETLCAEEYNVVRQNGSQRFLSFNAAPVLGRDGVRRAAVVVMNDVTAARGVERDLARFKFLLDAGVEEVYLVRPDGLLAYANEAAAHSLGCQREELVGRNMGDIDRRFTAGALGELMGSVREGPQTFETVHYGRGGRRFAKEIKAFYMRFGDEEFICGFGQDITERKRIQGELQRARALFAAALQQTRTGIIVAEAETGAISIMNPAAQHMLGLTSAPEAVTYRFPAGWSATRPDGNPYRDDDHPLRRALDLGEDTENFEVFLEIPEQPARWLLINASPIRDASGAVQAGIMSMTDITGRKQMECQLRFKAQHDALTGLPNRSLCLDRIAEALLRAKGVGSLFVVAFLGLDFFKMLNDSLGHSFGDSVLAEAAQRLVQALGERGLVSRFGGDEFVLLVEGDGGSEAAQALVRRAMDDLRQPMRVEGREVRLSVSAGVVVGPTADSPTAESVLQNADLAMHQAKESGRDRIRLFHPGMLRHAVELLSLDADMRHGLERDEFVVFYQPVMRAGDGRMTGMEALVRWRNPRRGLVAPCSFIPYAEDSGLIVPLGELVLKRACATVAAWRKRFPASRELTLAVNLSARQFAQPDIVGSVRRILDETGLPPELLNLELTESTLMSDPESALSAMRRLKDLGVSLSIDDFGTGYSSLAYLQRFPVDVLKIDRSFVRDLGGGDSDSLALVRAIVALAGSLHMRIVAEGVENRRQLEILDRLGCGSVQGYLFNPPLPEKQFLGLLDAELLDAPELPSANLRPADFCSAGLRCGGLSRGNPQSGGPPVGNA